MGRTATALAKIQALLADGKPRSSRDVALKLRRETGSTSQALRRAWESGAVLRTTSPIYETERRRHGRAGTSTNIRAYHLYCISAGEKENVISSQRFVGFSKKYLDARGGGGHSKSKAIRNFLASNSHKAFYSTEIARALIDVSVKIRDVMACVRRLEAKRLVYVRGYRTNERQTPFKEGYLITWIDPETPREKAIEEAVKRTDIALAGRAATSPIIERVHRIRDIVLMATKTRDLLSQSYVARELNCSEYEAEGALQRALQLYPDLKSLKLFNAYNYYYHNSMQDDDLQAAIGMKENYIRIEKGRDNRIGHNWEAAVEWFVDKFTTGATFREQSHRNQAMDQRRITLYLIKSVGGRVSNAEVDRIWTVTPGLFSPPTTYVLSCKWGLIRKRDVDDFLNVLRWSKDFGVDTPEGRQLKQGVTGLFAGSAFKPDEKVVVGGQTMSLASYADRLNISLLKAADFNEKLREHGCRANLTVQSICKVAKDENEVREILEAVWRKPIDADKILADAVKRNEKLYHFERMLEGSQKVVAPIVSS
jgi:hypothetical protein